MKVPGAVVALCCASLLVQVTATEDGTTGKAETTSEAKSTLLTTIPVPWFPTESSHPPSSDVEIVRSIELDYDLKERENETDSNSGENTSLASEGSNLFLKRLTEKPEFKASPSIPFIFDDVLLQSEKQEPCKEIRTRSISEEEEPDNDFDFHSRLLLGKFLLRRSDSSESSSTRQSRVLDFEPIHTSKNDYPVETVTKKTYVSPRRYSARVRSKPSNSSRPVNGRRAPLIEQSLSSSSKNEDIEKGDVSATTRSNLAEQETLKPKRNEEEVAAANRLEFGAKTSDRGSIKHKTRSQFTTSPPPQEVETHTVSNTAAPHVEYNKPSGEYEYREAQEEKRPSYSSVTIQRGNIDQIPYVLAKDIQFVPVHVQKQPTQVIFIHPYASEYKQRPQSPDVPTTPVFDNHQWVPIQAEDNYVPVLVGPPGGNQGQLYPVNRESLNRLQHINDPNTLRHHIPQHHFHNGGSLALRTQLQPHTPVEHTAPSTVYLNNHRSIDILPSGPALSNYPPREIPQYGK